MSYKDIAAATNMQNIDLKRTLQALACDKFKLLVKEPKSREVGENDTFYSSPHVLSYTHVSSSSCLIVNRSERMIRFRTMLGSETNASSLRSRPLRP